MVPAVKPLAGSPQESAPKHRVRRIAIGVLIGVVIALVVAVSLFIHFWPFEESRVLADLRQASGDSRIELRAFHKTYFPPGCILEGAAFTRGPDKTKPLITVEKLTITSSYHGILAQHIDRIAADGMKVSIPAFGSSQPFKTHRSKITVGEITAKDAILEFAGKEQGKPPLRFDIHQISLRDVGWQNPAKYQLQMHTSEPPAEISAAGKFGVWDQKDAAQTPMSGEFKVEQLNLGVFHGIAGTLSSSGKFDGRLGHIDVSGSTDTPDFQVKSSVNHVPLKTAFNAYVDGMNGDVYLNRVDAHYRKTDLVAQGSIAKSANGKGKTTSLDIRSNKARIDDILLLFTKEKRAPMSGDITLTAKVTIPPGNTPFLKKVRLEGKFGIEAGEFSKPSTQESVDKLSAASRGEKDPTDPSTVLTDLKGQVLLENGVGKFSDLSFGVPGADARMHGTYNLINHAIDLRGQMRMDSQLSNTTSGAKAFMLKVIQPFFKKRKKGEIVPVRISGTYEKPSFGLDLRDKKAQNVATPPPPEPGKSKKRRSR